VKRQDDDMLAAERQAGADRTQRAENGQAAARSETDRVTRDAADARASAQAEADRLKSNNDARMLASQSEAARLKKENDDKTLLARNEAAGLKADNDAQRAAAQTELDRVGSEKDRLEREKVALRAQLLLQFNAILQTRDTARGLIVNMSDVLFETGKFSLQPDAREKLARVAGIVEGHPGLSLAVEGYTDSVGTDDYNQTLSENRGGSVRDDLIRQGMAAGSVTSAGFGKTQPVASNDTADGRQQNRRVEIVISGDIIGTEIGIPAVAR
jgi:outer membrane protein OmpA-like peptidoglycan-associated protein